jgi:hypothetical protein
MKQWFLTVLCVFSVGCYPISPLNPFLIENIGRELIQEEDGTEIIILFHDDDTRC